MTDLIAALNSINYTSDVCAEIYGLIVALYKCDKITNLRVSNNSARLAIQAVINHFEFHKIMPAIKTVIFLHEDIKKSLIDFALTTAHWKELISAICTDWPKFIFIASPDKTKEIIIFLSQFKNVMIKTNAITPIIEENEQLRERIAEWESGEKRIKIAE